MTIYLLLSTYNGERYLLQQVESLRSQTQADWTLLIRDDGSTDGTPSLLRKLAANDSRIRLIGDDKGNLGAPGSFAQLLQTAHSAGAEYAFLVDQDDVWHPDKMQASLEAMAAEEARSPGQPVLVHSDLRVVDENLAEIAPSFFAFMKLRALPGGSRTFRLLCIQNFVTGCTVCCNRSAMDAALPMPISVAMHDWWLALCVAAANGHLVFVNRPLMDYRQHAANVVGAQGGYWENVNIFNKSILARFRKSDKNFNRVIRQLELYILHAQNKNLDTQYVAYSRSLLDILKMPILSSQRARKLLKLRPRRLDLLRTIFLYRRLLITRSR